MTTTSYPVNHPLAVKLWGVRMLREALKETYVSRFMGKPGDTNALIYVKNELNKSSGDRIRIPLRMQLTGQGIVGDGTLEGNEEALVTYSDDLLIDQLGHAVRSSGEMSEQRVPHSVREEAVDGLRDWWADRIDTSFFNQAAGDTSVSQTYAGMNLPTAPTGTASPTNCRIIYGSGSTSTTTSLTASSSNSASIRGLFFNTAALDVALNLAKIASPMIRPLRINGQSKYVCFVHPNQARYMRQTNTANVVTWYDVMRARVEGGEKDNPLYNGALGEYNGVILHESTRVPAPTASGNANFRRAVFCGAQAVSFGTGQRDRDVKMKWTEELFDYENQLGVAARMIWGMKKMVFNSIDFGSLVIQTYAPPPAV